MGGLTWFLFIYCLGGLTFLPLLIIALLLHAYFTFPVRDDADSRKDDESISRPGDDVDAIKSAQRSLGEKFQLHNNHEADVAAGYFAICREYSPGGVNGKPPERTTPVGSTAVSAPSPSVYQSMYRSLFERKTNNGPLDNKAAGKPQKKGGNVFYVVLRHGHLMLFDDDDQLEVRYVVSLAHHDVGIYSGPNDITPEGELFIKRNAICLSRKRGVGEMTADGKPSQPFYLFSENCSDKEDFYFALLRNQESGSTPKPPVPLQYDVKDIITLVQRLHSSEEHLQTRWINALIGRIFLALYKTPEIENFIRAKITKKISRVKTPNFLRQITLRNVDMGAAAPVITNPRLKDLTVDGQLIVEADVRYTGSFRLEVAAIARLELGARFKAREVNLLLAVVLKKIEGHMLLRIKPPPSNRLWVTFETMPKIDMTIEPIVSSRQITYTLILRQIENRIKEVVAESLVFPNWDDSPFASSVDKLWRGGIWADDRRAEPSENAETIAAEDGDVDEVDILEAERDDSTASTPPVEKSYSTPVLDTNFSKTMHSRKGIKSTSNLTGPFSGSSSGVDARPSTGDKPRALRSGSFANASSPVVTTDITNADAFKPSSPPNEKHAATAMAKLSAKSDFPSQSPTGSPNRPTNIRLTSSQSSSSSRDSSHSEKASTSNFKPQTSLDPSLFTDKSSIKYYPSSPASLSTASIRSEYPILKASGTPKRENTTSSAKSSTSETKRLSLAAVTNAAATAKTWGWNAIQRRSDQKASSSSESMGPTQPRVMGRGQPLPPPGVPLPPPDKKTKTAPIPVPKRKLIPLPVLPQRHQTEAATNRQHQNSQPPPLPRRASRKNTDTGDNGLLVVSAPSEPTTPVTEDSPQYLQPWVDDVDESMEEHQQSKDAASSLSAPVAHEPPQLPKRRHPRRVVSTSPEEDGHKLPSWMAAQEQEARTKSNFVDEDTGL
ncbi:hypothetical protein SBOR_10039 [Sclerotinia borealis F-4128]|uniref:SMP-LTD domain-containing protein n=1 Tax=Sclerotinia borealis (strain F-4128) TaxID=1432307 RepID=W9C4S4_SCLBF|nr:hypothetical protein SBOR_10039 [Sclerotinia borealis F-4128]